MSQQELSAMSMLTMIQSACKSSTPEVRVIYGDMAEIRWLEDGVLMHNKPCSLADATTYRSLNVICKEAKRIINRKRRLK